MYDERLAELMREHFFAMSKFDFPEFKRLCERTATLYSDDPTFDRNKFLALCFRGIGE